MIGPTPILASNKKSIKRWNINILWFLCFSVKNKNIVKLFVKFYYVRLFLKEKYYNIIGIGNEIKADVGVTFNSSTIVERLEVVFIMLDFLIFLIIGFMISITINVALLSVIYIILSNKQQ